MKIKEPINKIIKSVTGDLCLMSKSDFQKELESRKDGDIARLLQCVWGWSD